MAAEAQDATAVGGTAASRREQVGWCFYDWSASAFTTTVVVVFIGPYLTTVAKAAAEADGYVRPLGIAINSGAFYPFVVSFAVALQVLCLPILGAIADYTHLKKRMLAAFAYGGALLTAALVLPGGRSYLLVGGIFIGANLCYGASAVFYNAFLADVASPDQRDAVSSWGWTLSALGGGLLLAANFGLLYQADALGMSQDDALRITLASAGVWWALFALIPVATLRSRSQPKRMPHGESYLGVGFRQLRATLAKVRRQPLALTFLLAYVLYNEGIQTVTSMSTAFGQEAVGLSYEDLALAILVVQFVAIPGTVALLYVAKAVGTKPAIVLSLVIWSAAIVYAYGFLRTREDFLLLAGVIGLVIGGSQALSRSVYSLMVPKGQESEYFSLYAVFGGGTTWIGPLFFGLALQATGSYRVALLSLVVFFVLGVALLARVDIRRAASEAGNEAPARA